MMVMQLMSPSSDDATDAHITEDDATYAQIID